MLPSPPIILNQNDFMHDATILHFSDMFSRYGAPIVIINLLRVNMKNKENSLAEEYLNTVNQLNSQLPKDFQILYHSFDIKNEIKKSKKNYEEKFYCCFKDVLPKIGVFVASVNPAFFMMKFQVGVVRTNCVDCIDRTNEGQLLISHLALEMQMAELGICQSLSKKCEIVQILTKLFEEMGDAIALQYSGSIAHKATNSKEKSKQSKLIVATKRHLANLIKDSKKQQAINLFLGIYKADLYPIPLWDIPDDFRLHNRQIVYNRNRGKWWKYEVKKYLHRIGLKISQSPTTPNPKNNKNEDWRKKFLKLDKKILMTQNTKNFSIFEKKNCFFELIEANFQEDFAENEKIFEENSENQIKDQQENENFIVAAEDIELFKTYTKIEDVREFYEFEVEDTEEVISTKVKDFGVEQFLKYLDLKDDPELFLKKVEDEEEIFESFY
jgi:hypothetical protein